MDGIKRYVVELLRALAAIPAAQRPEIDVLVRDRVHSLDEAVGIYLGHRDTARSDNCADQSDYERGSRNRIFSLVAGLIPPGILFVLRAVIPAWACRRLFGKEKSELRRPVAPDTLGSYIGLLLPPLLVRMLLGALSVALPSRIVGFLWTSDLLRPVAMIADTHGYDLAHVTLPNNEHYLPSKGAPLLVTVHDLCHIACPQHQTRANNFTLRIGLERAVRNDARFLSVSNATREQMIDAYAVDASRITTVLSAADAAKFHPVDDVLAHARIRDAYGISNQPFLLTLSTLEPRKNLDGVVKAFEILTGELGCADVSLVIAGTKGWKSTEIMRAAARNPGRVHLTGYVDDHDLTAIYSAATGFVYVSHYEGFGLPLLEAMHCGAPVIYGDNSSMPEIVGDAGLAADADDPRDIARQMHRLVASPKHRAELSERALRRAAEFRWQRTAEQTVQVYEAAIASLA